MEKIIAVVVMIAIVIGLIATAVLPMVTQMNEQGSTAQSQLSTMTVTMDGTQMTGSTVKAEIESQKAKFALTQDALTKITVQGQNADGSDAKLVTIDGEKESDRAPQIADAFAAIPNDALFTKTETKHNSGKVKEIAYVIVKAG